MKRYLLILLYTLIGLYAHAQNNFNDDYHPLVQEGKTWRVLEATWQFPIPPSPIGYYTYETRSFMFKGDTIIDDKEYKKLYSSFKENPIFPNDWWVFSFMREDEEKKVFHLKRNGFGEQWVELLYDFSLEIGDTVHNPWGDNFPAVVVEDITYEKMNNGEERKFFWLSSFHSGSDSKEYWIEGMGSMIGLIYPLYGEIVGGFYEMLCFNESDKLLFVNSNYNTCYKSSVGIEDYENIINIYPNPAKAIIHFENTNNIDIISGFLINIYGQIIKQFEPNITQINISNIPSGIYFVKFSTSNGNVIQKISINQ